MNASILRFIRLVTAGLFSCLFFAAALPMASPAPDGRPSALGTDPSAAAPELQTTARVINRNAIDYADDVAPIIARLGCAHADCHGSANGKGGLRLSLFGAEPKSDYEALTRAGGGRRINTVEPSRSLLLLKITATLPHGDKRRTAVGSPEYRTMAAWIAQGAPWYSPDRPHLIAVRIAPPAGVLAVGGSGKLKVTAAYADGSTRDVTRDAVLRAAAPEVAGVGPDGRIAAHRYGQCVIVATYMRRFALAQVLVPQKLPFPFPSVRANNPIDALNFARLKRLGIPPSDLCTDAVFLRRVYLDVIGLLPTPEEARSFLADSRPDKRARLIDSLLTRNEFADRWALKWSDLLRIKSEYPVRLWPKAVQTYYRWLRQSIVENKPYDRFVTELLTSSGSNFRDGPANYYRAVASRDPQTFGETTALLFMGVRVGCSRCHGHPYTNWSLDDDAGMAAFFGRMAFKPTQEWKEEIVYSNPEAVYRHPRTSQVVRPKYLDGGTLKPGDDADPRERFAQWLTSPGNPWFSRNIANRVWYWLIGRGIVEEPDDIRPTNPPSNPELLDYLASELAKHRYDLRWLYRLILNSRTYQLSGTPTRWNREDASGFSHYIVKRLDAGQMLDAVGQVTGAYEGYYTWIPEPYMHLPTDTRAQQVADGSIETPFLDMFGRSPRDMPYESGKCSRPSMAQAMVLANSGSVDNKVLYGSRLQGLLQSGKTDAQVVEELYLAALSRFPTAREKQTVLAYLARDPKTRAQALQDVEWALLNTKEFLFIR
jgi:hypothetical protein